MELHPNDRRLRVQYPDALYHVMARGVHRGPIFLDTEDRQLFFDRCEAVVERFQWVVFAIVLMTNHFHLLFRTPQPNLCRGAQYLLGPYARSFNRRHGLSGHVLEGRYRCRVIESHKYLWGVSRYDHLNPVPVLAEHPAAWRWSSYPGYVDPTRRLPWVAYDEFLEAWTAEFGGSGQSYCDYVENGLRNRDQVRLPELADGWIIGSDSFVERIRAQVSPNSHEPHVRRVRNRPIWSLDELTTAITEEFGVGPEALQNRSSHSTARRVFALLGKQLTTATLSDIADVLGLSGRDSLHKTIQRTQLNLSSDVETQIRAIESRLKANRRSRGSTSSSRRMR